MRLSSALSSGAGSHESRRTIPRLVFLWIAFAYEGFLPKAFFLLEAPMEAPIEPPIEAYARTNGGPNIQRPSRR